MICSLILRLWCNPFHWRLFIFVTRMSFAEELSVERFLKVFLLWHHYKGPFCTIILLFWKNYILLFIQSILGLFLAPSRLCRLVCLVSHSDGCESWTWLCLQPWLNVLPLRYWTDPNQPNPPTPRPSAGWTLSEHFNHSVWPYMECRG